MASGVVYVGSFDDKLYAFNATSGALRSGWPVSTGGLIVSSPAVANGVVYVGSNDDKLYAFNATSGSFLWAAATGDVINLSSPAVADGMLYVGSFDHSLHAYSLGVSLSPRAADLAASRPDPATLVPDYSLQLRSPSRSSEAHWRAGRPGNGSGNGMLAAGTPQAFRKIAGRRARK